MRTRYHLTIFSFYWWFLKMQTTSEQKCECNRWPKKLHPYVIHTRKKTWHLPCSIKKRGAGGSPFSPNPQLNFIDGFFLLKKGESGGDLAPVISTNLKKVLMARYGSALCPIVPIHLYSLLPFL